MYTKVGIVHATTMAITPIAEAFQQLSYDIELVHVMDTGLLPLLQSNKEMTPYIRRRFLSLISLVNESDVKCIQLTCSAFNNLVPYMQYYFKPKIFRSDEAMLDQALFYNNIAIVATVSETPDVLTSYLRNKRNDINIKYFINTDAFNKLKNGKKEEHDTLIIDLVNNINEDFDVIILAQYALSDIVPYISSNITVLSPPFSSANRCIDYIKEI